MKAAMVASWTHPFPGREEKALAYGAEVEQFWSAQAAEGRCTPPETFFSDAGIGFWIVQGDRDELLRISDSEPARLLTMKGDLLVDSFRVEIYHAGEAAQEYLAQYGTALAAMA